MAPLAHAPTPNHRDRPGRDPRGMWPSAQFTGQSADLHGFQGPAIAHSPVSRLVLHSHGAPLDVLRLVDDPPAKPLATHATVRVLAAPINPMDLLMIRGLYPLQPPLPTTPGAEGVGQVVAVGDAGQSSWLGKRVILPIRHGTWRTHTNVPLADLIEVPAELSLLQAACLRVNPPSAHLMLAQAGDLAPGSWIIQSPANGAVGQCIVQLAARRGWRTINVVRQASRGSFLRDLGGDAVVEFDERLPQRVHEMTAGAPVMLALDGSGGSITAGLARCLAAGGVVVTYGAMSRQAPQMPIHELVFRRIRLQGFWLLDWVSQHGDHALRTVLDQLARHPLAIRVAGTYRLHEYANALTHAQDPQRDGRVFLVADGVT